jgi:hypothetical protein
VDQRRKLVYVQEGDAGGIGGQEQCGGHAERECEKGDSGGEWVCVDAGVGEWDVAGAGNGLVCCRVHGEFCGCGGEGGGLCGAAVCAVDAKAVNDLESLLHCVAFGGCTSGYRTWVPGF